MNLSRRDFIKGSLAGAAALAVSSIPGAAYADKSGILSEEKTYEEGQYSFEIPPEKVPESEINETLDVDICIMEEIGEILVPLGYHLKGLYYSHGNYKLLLQNQAGRIFRPDSGY